MHQLTKYDLLNGKICQKRLWLDHNNLIDAASVSDAYLTKLGKEIGHKAQLLFSNGVQACPQSRTFKDAVNVTSRVIEANDASTLFEPAFEFDGVRIRCDVLRHTDDMSWELNETKAVLELRDEHITGIAIQVWVLRNLGFNVKLAKAIILNRDYVRDENGIDWTSFLTIVDVTDRVEAVVAEIPHLALACAMTVANSEEPAIAPGKHCPADCVYWKRCTAKMPADWVFYLPNLSRDKFYKLSELNVLSIVDVPEDFPLSKTQNRIRDLWQRQEDYLSPCLCDELTPASLPTYYLDFEAASSPIPLFEGHKPFQRLSFQWSLHFLDTNKQFSHDEFLAEASYDPRRKFSETLLAALDSDDYPIVVYSGYERSILRELSDAFPDLASSLQKIVGRLFDLLPVVRKHTYFRNYQGSFSIKKVEPALTGSIARPATNTISNGQDAAFSYLTMFDATDGRGDVDRDVINAALLDYCRHDTKALMNVHMQLLDRAECETK